MRSSACLLALAPLFLLTACNNSVVIELDARPQMFELNASALGLPAALRAGDGTVASLDCSVAMCPSTTEVPVTCSAGVCNPDPLTIAVEVGEVIDFQAMLAEASTLIRVVDEIEIARANFNVAPNGLTVDLPSVEVLWAPEAAVSVDEATLLGTLPVIAAGVATAGDLNVDAAGAAALSDFVLGTTGRIRIFARTAIDLEPGGAFPDGGATVTVNLRLRAIGRIID